MDEILEFEKKHSPGTAKYACFSKDSLKYIFDNSDSCKAFGLIVEDELVGIGIYRDGGRYYPKRKAFEVCSIIVHKDYRKEGYGTKILNKIVDEIKSNHSPEMIMLTVSPLNKSAMITYLKNGFIVCGYKEESWGGESRVVMEYKEIS